MYSCITSACLIFVVFVRVHRYGFAMSLQKTGRRGLCMCVVRGMFANMYGAPCSPEAHGCQRRGSIVFAVLLCLVSLKQGLSLSLASRKSP